MHSNGGGDNRFLLESIQRDVSKIQEELSENVATLATAISGLTNTINLLQSKITDSLDAWRNSVPIKVFISVCAVLAIAFFGKEVVDAAHQWLSNGLPH